MRLMNAPVALPIREASQIGEARRIARAITAQMGFDETMSERAALIVSEAATNLVRHTPGGELLLRPLAGTGGSGLEILALDQGPGMASVAECMKDGFSTTGTSGNGLGAISRLATSFDIHSSPGIGTALLARLWPVGAPQGP